MREGKCWVSKGIEVLRNLEWGLWILFILVNQSLVIAQEVVSKPDSTELLPPPIAPQKQKAFHLILDNRNSFIRGSDVKFIGLNIGFRLKEKYRIGIGAYALRPDYSQLNVPLTTHNPDSLSFRLGLDYFTPNFTYTFFNSRWLEANTLLEVGLGRSHIAVYNSQDQLLRRRDGTFVPVELGLGLIIKPTRWVGCSVVGGYRKSLREANLQGGFDGWYYSYRLNIFLSNIIYDWKQHRAQRMRK